MSVAGLARRRGGIAAVVTMALAAIVLVAGGLVLRPTSAEAHASLIKASPSNNETLRRPPTRVTLNFSEGIERKLTTIQVTDKDKKRVDTNDLEFDDRDPAFASVGVKTLDPGLYFVRWSNVSSVDGHEYSGSYPFIVLKPDGTFPEGVTLQPASATSGGGNLLPNNWDSAVKWIALLALSSVAGAAFYLAVVLRPAARFLEDDQYNEVTDAGERHVINLAHVLLPAAFIAAAVLVLLTVSRFNTNTGLWEYLTTVRTGKYRGVQLLLLLVALAGADLLFLAGTKRKRDIGLGVLLLASAGAMLAYSMISHSATGAGRFWATISDFVHLAASSAWLGALVMLPLVLRARLGKLNDAERWLYLANMFDRFSIVAGVSVIAVLATGTFNGLVELDHWSNFVDTTYGKVLLAKLILIVPLLAVAGLNAAVLKPRFVNDVDRLYQQGGTGTEPERASWAADLARLKRWLPRTIMLEIALVVAVFASVSVLTQTSTAKGEIAQDKAGNAKASDFNQTAELNGLKLTLQVKPNQVGLNEFSLQVQNSDGTPLTTVTQARLRFDYDDVQNAVAPSEIILNKFADGDYRGAGSYFTQPGNWRVSTTVRRSDGDDIARSFILPVVRGATTTKAGGGSAFELPFKTFNWNEVLGAGLALAGVVLVIYRKQLRWMASWANRGAMSAAVVLMLAGGVLAFGVHNHTTALDPRNGNPILPTKESVAQGKELFQQNCVACHGIDGRGDGPAAASLNPAPSDFRLHVPLHTDPQFYNFIANGYPGSAMPAFKDQFSADDIWNLVNFLRQTFNEAPTQ